MDHERNCTNNYATTWNISWNERILNTISNSSSHQQPNERRKYYLLLKSVLRFNGPLEIQQKLPSSSCNWESRSIVGVHCTPSCYELLQVFGNRCIECLTERSLLVSISSIQNNIRVPLTAWLNPDISRHFSAVLLALSEFYHDHRGKRYRGTRLINRISRLLLLRFVLFCPGRGSFNWPLN